jgi:hypothetical protein
MAAIVTSLVLLPLALLEAGAWLHSHLTDRGGTAGALAERELFLNNLPPSAPGSVERDSRPLEQRPWYERAVLHPFFGFVWDRRGVGINNQGFGSPYVFPYRSDSREYVIGVFGGSVAGQVGSAPSPLKEALLPYLREKGYEKITVVNFALAGSKQPAAFYVLGYFLDGIDMAINFDGLNEAVQPDNQGPDYPVAFPARLIYGPLLSLAGSPYAAADGARLGMLNERAARLTTFFNGFPFRHSMFAHLVWRALAARHEAAVRPLRESIADAAKGDLKGIDPTERDGTSGSLKRYRQLYRDVTLYSDAITRAKRKLFFHFIQPNQYVTGSKILSKKERRLLSSPVGKHDGRYQRLDEMSRQLGKAGVESHSLSMIFADRRETLYRDGCCHLNARGVELLHHAMAERIIASGRLDSVPAVAGSQTGPGSQLGEPSP